MNLNDLIEQLKKSNDEEDQLLARVMSSSRTVPLQSVYEGVAKANPNSNFAKSPGLYMPRGAEVREYPTMLNASGFVLTKQPNTAFINRHFRDTDTVPHELAHVQQNQTNTYSPIEKTLGQWGTRELNKYLDAKKGVRDRTKQAIKEDKTGRLALNMAGSDRELTAELQGLEAMEPRGTNIMDTPLGKQLFPDAYSRRLYENMMYPGTHKLYPAEGPMPQGHEIQPSLIDLFRRAVRNYTGS